MFALFEFFTLVFFFLSEFDFFFLVNPPSFNFSSINFNTGDITLEFIVESNTASSWDFGCTAWLEFLGGDIIPTT